MANMWWVAIAKVVRKALKSGRVRDYVTVNGVLLDKFQVCNVDRYRYETVKTYVLGFVW